MFFIYFHLCLLTISGQPERINKVLQELGYDEQKPEDVDRLKQICRVMSERAARLASAGLAAIIKVGLHNFYKNY